MLKHFLTIARPLGILLSAFSAAFLPPILLAAFDGGAGLLPLLAGCAASLSLGFGLWAIGRNRGRELKARDGFLLIAMLWLMTAWVAAIPFALGLGLSAPRAWFEAVSGITTTGATVLSGLDQLPRALLFWRSELSWLGGLGILGLSMAALPLLGVGGMQVYLGEAGGPIKESKLTPRFVQTARSLWLIYGVLTLACVAALVAAGMAPFDAICHAFSALSLSAFSTRDEGLAAWDSPLIEAVLASFIIAAAINFASHFQAWRSRRLGSYLRDPQLVWMIAVLAMSLVPVFAALLAVAPPGGGLAALGHAAFHLVSVGLGSGLVAEDLGHWPLVATLWLLLLSCTLAAAGSTGGGIKIVRAIVLFRQASRDLYALVHPNAVSTLKVGRQPIRERTALAVVGFVHLYAALILVLSFALIASGLDLAQGFTTALAMINNSGVALHAGAAPSQFAALGDGQLLLCSAGMLFGRLELFVPLVLLTPAFWRR